MITLHQLRTGYPGKVIGRQLSATAQPGTLTALLGSNGSGKSTLLRTLAALQPPLNSSPDSLLLAGKPVQQYARHELARMLSVVLTHRPDSDALTVAEVVEMGRIPYLSTLSAYQRLWQKSVGADAAAVRQAMEQTATLPFSHRPLSTLSDGERQRVFIAKALAQGTPVILLDEPTAFLDFPSKVALMQLLQHLAHHEQKTIILSTHDVELALQFADHLWLLGTEGIVQGAPATLAADGSVARFFQTEGLQFDAATLRFTVSV